MKPSTLTTPAHRTSLRHLCTHEQISLTLMKSFVLKTCCHGLGVKSFKQHNKNLVYNGGLPPKSVFQYIKLPPWLPILDHLYSNSEYIFLVISYIKVKTGGEPLNPRKLSSPPPRLPILSHLYSISQNNTLLLGLSYIKLLPDFPYWVTSKNFLNIFFIRAFLHKLPDFPCWIISVAFPNTFFY